MRSNVLRFVIVIVALLAVFFSQSALSAGGSCDPISTVITQIDKSAVTDDGVVWWTLNFHKIDEISIKVVKQASPTEGCSVKYVCPAPELQLKAAGGPYYVQFKVKGCEYKILVAVDPPSSRLSPPLVSQFSGDLSTYRCPTICERS